ncbi:hypothetical protein PMAYCL1PPCAC_18560 [Pristionchus mayeri]|uniref:CUB domain-containing protein n=1 Tax=Pristionchus mayeri TaxID=1317129 RepID=A0AAN5CPS8_9BILA|nr:hypothetical protein PMAYCL1PPCAC_18560 [Pristionchus mayeri]
MIALLSLLLVFWPVIESSDTIFGRSYLIFESEGARSIISLQRSQHGNSGYKFLNVSIEHNVDYVPYQSILGNFLLNPNNFYPLELHNRAEEIKLIVNFIDPCCKDKKVASVNYTEESDTLLILYENCVQMEIDFESMDHSNVCYSSSLQLGSHCSLFCSCSSLPTDGCPSPDSAPIIKCNEFDNSFETCDYDGQPHLSHKMSFQWESGMAQGMGTIAALAIESQRAVDFKLINKIAIGVEFIFEHVFGSTIDGTNEFLVSFEESFVLTMKSATSTLSLRFDVSSQGEVSIYYKDCMQFKMTEKGNCYGGTDNGIYTFCEEDSDIFANLPAKTCANPLVLKKYAELKIFFVDNAAQETEMDTMGMELSSDSPEFSTRGTLENNHSPTSK